MNDSIIIVVVVVVRHELELCKIGKAKIPPTIIEFQSIPWN
jgi:hypothetical protein